MTRPKWSRGRPIFDNETCNYLKVMDINMSESWDHSVVPTFLTKYRGWIESTKNNTISLDSLPYTDFSAGTTEAYDKFYVRHANKRFRIFKAEYAYHKISFKGGNLKWCFIEDEPLTFGDAVIVSLPFADTGNDINFKHLITTCERYSIPVIVDCAYFGVCSGFDFDFSSPCIEDVCFSLSKTFPVGNLRIGARFSRQKYVDDSLTSYNQAEYVNNLSAAVGSRFISAFSPDYIYDKFKDNQLELCALLEIEPSACVIFGIDLTSRFSELNRGGSTNRLCLSEELSNAEISY